MIKTMKTLINVHAGNIRLIKRNLDVCRNLDPSKTSNCVSILLASIIIRIQKLFKHLV